MDRWRAFGLRLTMAGCLPVALTPCPKARWWSELTRVWRMVEWDRHAAATAGKDDIDRRKERLLALASTAIRLEPALLRDLRLLLGPAADAGTEADCGRTAG